MKIKITKIIDEETLKVYFETDLGVGFGFWKSKDLPKLNNTYDVEVDILDSLVWDKNVFGSNYEEEKICIEKDTLLIQGKVEKIESDEVAVIRLGDSILMIDTFESSPPLFSYVRIIATEVMLFNNNT